MVEGFLKQYIGVAGGYFTGLMEEQKADDEFLDDQPSHAIFFGCLNKPTHRLVSLCQEVYLVTKTEKRNWKVLPREKYLKPLIFHDGRLAFRPTPLASLLFFLWLPMGFTLSVIRLVAVATLPYKLLHLVTSFTRMTTTLSRPAGSSPEAQKTTLYVCNHRTLSNPIYVSALLMKPLTAVTYRVSRFSETVSPIKTVRLTRNREKDQEIIQKQLRNGDLVICPEGTTCREPYLLRFSPLFAEIAEEIVPVAIDMQVSMFYGTTVSGCKRFFRDYPNQKHIKKERNQSLKSPTLCRNRLLRLKV